MKQPMMWCYLLHLSKHWYTDETSPTGWYLPGYTYENATDLETWDKTVAFLAAHGYNTVLIDVGDAVQYESHPEVSAPDAWSKDFLKKKLDEIRALGMEPIPKLNFSTAHDSWLGEYGYMVSSTPYYKVCADLIREVCEIFGWPRLFHLGFDEEREMFQTNFGISIIRGEDLWWHDLEFLCRECEKHGARPWIWSDYIWHHKDVFVKRMSKSILQSNWFYYHFNEAFYKRDHKFNEILSYELLDELGFDQVPTCSSFTMYKFNPYQTVAFVKDRMNPTHIKGIMTAPWIPTQANYLYDLYDDAYRLYYARKTHYPETLS